MCFGENLSKESVIFVRMKLQVYKSFEEQAAAEAAEAANQTPLDRIRETVELILRVYGVSREDLINRKKSNRIKVIQYK
jgi:hypothetical protein